ncbi:MAG: winged helix-turn-helix transcriptional regulator [Chloroflexi bacterium]|nr:winged helix-turn-helix transcriptional regulator [Chloroflexota bacterium]
MPRATSPVSSSAVVPVSPSRAFPPVRIVSGPGFELIAELAAFTSGPARASLESGKPWIREVRRLAGPELLARVERYNLGVYAELTTIALEADARGLRELVAAIAALPAEAFRRRLLGADSGMSRSLVADGAFDRALAGDPPARAELRSTLANGPADRQVMDRLFADDPAATRAEIGAIVADWAAKVFPAFEPEAMAAIERDAAAKEAALADRPAQDVLAAATAGVDVAPPPWIRSIAIVPTVALRPFVIPAEVGETAAYICSVADESFDVDPDAPPRRLVKLAAALGDELRMRILHALRDESLSASQIADRLGVDRTSLHHHLGILRSAGLLTIVDDGVAGWRYALREGAVNEIGPALDEYLRSPRT